MKSMLRVMPVFLVVWALGASAAHARDLDVQITVTTGRMIGHLDQINELKVEVYDGRQYRTLDIVGNGNGFTAREVYFGRATRTFKLRNVPSGQFALVANLTGSYQSSPGPIVRINMWVSATIGRFMNSLTLNATL